MPDVDLFASRINAQLETYVTWRPDPNAVHIDALTLNWTNIYGYAFPPFSLIARVLRKVEEEQTTTLLILPRWPTRPWYPRVMRRLVELPILLPRRCLHLPQDKTLRHPLERNLDLIACKVSGKAILCQAFRRRLLSSFSRPGEMGREDNMTCTLTQSIPSIICNY